MEMDENIRGNAARLSAFTLSVHEPISRDRRRSRPGGGEPAR